MISLDTNIVITTFYSGALATNGGEFGKASLAIWSFEQRVVYVSRWRSASGVSPESGLAVVLGDEIDTLSSGIFTNCNGSNGQNLLLSQ